MGPLWDHLGNTYMYCMKGLHWYKLREILIYFCNLKFLILRNARWASPIRTCPVFLFSFDAFHQRSNSTAMVHLVFTEADIMLSLLQKSKVLRIVQYCICEFYFLEKAIQPYYCYFCNKFHRRKYLYVCLSSSHEFLRQ